MMCFLSPSVLEATKIIVSKSQVDAALDTVDKNKEQI